MPTASKRARLVRVLLAALCSAGVLGTSTEALGQSKYAEVVQTAVSATALKPGAAAMAAVVLEIKPGFHAQSSTPTEDYLVAFTADVEPPAGVRAGKPVFPKGQVKEYPGLGKLSVYDGRVVVRIPLDVAAGAKPGDVTIKGKLNYQICDDKSCFPPDATPFTITAKVGGPGEEAKPANADLFKGYLPDAGGGKVGKPIDPAVRAAVDAALNVSALQPGKPAKLAVVVDVAPGFHAQSNTPAEDLIATTLELQPTPGLSFGRPAYPPGKQETYPGVGTLSVYGGRTVVLVPVEVRPDAPVGSDAKIAGGVTVQICDDKGTCFPPRTLPFELTAKVVAATEQVAANEPGLFDGGPTPPAPPATGRWVGRMGTEGPYDDLELTVAGGKLQITKAPTVPVSCFEMGGAYRSALSFELFDAPGPWTIGTDEHVAKEGIAVNQLVGGGARGITYKVTGTTQEPGRVAGTLGMSFFDSKYDVFTNRITFINCAGAQSFEAVPA